MIESTAAASSSSVGIGSPIAAATIGGANSTNRDSEVRLPAYIAAQKNSTAVAQVKHDPISSKKFIENEINSFKNTIFLAFEKK
jgi:hypothetical protein